MVACWKKRRMRIGHEAWSMRAKVHVYIHTHIYTCMHIYIHAYVYIHLYIQTNIHIREALPRLMRMAYPELKSKINSSLCASVSTNVFICLPRKWLSSVTNSCSNYWLDYLFLALDLFIYFGILVGRPIFNETRFIYFSYSLSLCVHPSLADRSSRPPIQNQLQ